MKMIAVVLGVLGGVVGLGSAISAFVMVGTDPAYSARLWVGWLALLLALVAGGAAPLIYTRPVAASLTMVITGFAGFVCINFFYINTFYGLAVPLWIIGAVLGFISARKVRSVRSN
ncbi:MAG TPA: hypothetical protein VE843_11560 [Ktedonobacteraceae bacterium]|nr:hypothetical protein [Ktedonobacteraceae bacterium]